MSKEKVRILREENLKNISKGRKSFLIRGEGFFERIVSLLQITADPGG
jgi:hypothetical protein